MILSLILLVLFGPKSVFLSHKQHTFGSLQRERIIPLVRSGGTAVLPIKSEVECQLLKLQTEDVVAPKRQSLCESKLSINTISYDI